MPLPDSAFNEVHPDIVAEIWDGVIGAGMYEPLWNAAEKASEEAQEDSDIEPKDVTVAGLWEYFTEAEQEKLNKLAEQNR